MQDGLTEAVLEDLDPDKAIGENIQRYRKAAGMTQAQLADRLSEYVGQQVHQQTVLKIEKGTRPLRYTEARWFADVLEVPLEALAEGADVSTQVARQVEDREAIADIRDELNAIGDRLGYALLRIAIGVSINRDKKGDSAAMRFVSESSERILLWDWGASLNDRIMMALKQQPYLAQIKPKFKADNYSEVLVKVSQTPVRHWNESDGSAT